MSWQGRNPEISKDNILHNWKSEFILPLQSDYKSNYV